MSNPQNKSDKMAKRAARPGSLASALGDLMVILGVRASDADLAGRWDAIMGAEIASIANLAAIKKTRDGKYNIVLRPINPALTLQLSYMVPEITARINKYFGRDAVAKISFRK